MIRFLKEIYQNKPNYKEEANNYKFIIIFTIFNFLLQELSTVNPLSALLTNLDGRVPYVKIRDTNFCKNSVKFDCIEKFLIIIHNIGVVLLFM